MLNLIKSIFHHPDNKEISHSNVQPASLHGVFLEVLEQGASHTGERQLNIDHNVLIENCGSDFLFENRSSDLDL